MGNKDAKLEYHDQIWQGEDGPLFVRLNNDTFYRHVQQYLTTQYGAEEPTIEQRKAAITHCRALSYWQESADSDVRIGYKGGHKPMVSQSINQSAITALLNQIHAEDDAAHQALYGLTMGATRHDFIHARMQRVQTVSQHLIDALGKDEALPIIVAALDRLNS